MSIYTNSSISNQKSLPDYRIREEMDNFKSILSHLFITSEQHIKCINSFQKIINKLDSSVNRQTFSERALDAVCLNVQNMNIHHKKFLVEILELDWNEYKGFI